jgi:hypothetical protein
MLVMLQARDAVSHRSWSHPQEPITDAWWADDKRDIILVACSKCDWRAAFSRASHGADYAMPNLLNYLAAPNCSRLGSHWDRCGVHYVEPIEGSR